MAKINLHSHTTYCDGKNSPEEMALAAMDRGFDVFGFSGHSYTAFDESYCMSRSMTDAYEREVRRLASSYQKKLTILCGIEQDIFSGLRKSAGTTPSALSTLFITGNLTGIFMWTTARIR